MARVIYWFRTDLRIHDSPALSAALDLEPEAFWPIWTWDPHYVFNSRVSANRWQYLIDCQNELSSRLTDLNDKSRLFVFREAPSTVLPKLFKAWKVTHIVFERDTDAYARERDSAVAQKAKESGVEVISVSGRTLWNPDDIVECNEGEPTMSLKQLESAIETLGDPPKPVDTPKGLPDPGDLDIGFKHERPSVKVNLNKDILSDSSFEHIAGPRGDFAVPTLKELGLKQDPTTQHRGGERRALAQLDKLAKDTKFIATFEKPKTAPTAWDPPATTLLSPHLHFGSLGVRELYWRVRDIADSYKGKATQPPVSLTGQLLFREMFFAAQAKVGRAFAQTKGNPYCRVIDWRLQNGNEDDREAHEWLERWANGQTGFPWIDAAMRQLRSEGWIHHLARHAVACFLTRGGCYISWERGAEVFEELLLDHEPACNAGNWQWLSCTAFYAMFYRCYSPVTFPKKWDPNGDYVRKYVPELADIPSKHIYEPWKAPQKPKNYPKPMFDFAKQRQICIDGMKSAYAKKQYGDTLTDGPSRKKKRKQ